MRSNRMLPVLTMIVAGILGAIYMIMTRPPVPPTDAGSTRKEQSVADRDPLKVPLLAHMHEEEGIDIGTTITATSTPDVVAIRKGDEIEVILSEKLLQRLGPDALVSLQMTDRYETMTWERYNRFVSALHELIIAKSPHKE